MARSNRDECAWKFSSKKDQPSDPKHWFLLPKNVLNLNDLPGPFGESCFGPIFRLWAHFLGRCADLPKQGRHRVGDFALHTAKMEPTRQERPENRRAGMGGSACRLVPRLAKIRASDCSISQNKRILLRHHRSIKPCFDAEKEHEGACQMSRLALLSCLPGG